MKPEPIRFVQMKETFDPATQCGLCEQRQNAEELLVQHEEIANLAVELFKPPYRGNCGIRLEESDRIQDERMDELRIALIAAGYSWEEWT